MNTVSLVNDIIQTDSFHFRKAKLGDSIELVEQLEGTPTEKNAYSDPFYHYFMEIGEMEEINLYYNYFEDTNSVSEITLHLTHYPDHYWKKEGNTDPVEFWNLLNNNQLQPYSMVFTDTVSDVIAFFTEKLDQQPVTSSEAHGVFDAPHNNYRLYKWAVDDQYYISVQTYVDDSIDHNVKNTMKLRIIKQA